MEKIINKLKTLCMITILIGCLFSNISLAKDTMIVSWDEWPPHQTKNEKGDLIGINIELITKICERAGYKVNFNKMPWKRGLHGLKTGKVDIVLSASKTAEREKYAYFSDSYFKLEYNVMFARKKDKAKFSSIKSLKDIIGTDFKVGMLRGSIYSDEHDELSKNKQFTEHLKSVTSTEQNIKKLMKGRIDGFIEDELGGASKIKELGFEKEIDILFYLYGEEEASAYLMFSKKSLTKVEVDKLNSALKAMKSDGSYQKLIAKYQLSQSEN